jgi:hypothetical protein
MSSIKGVTTAPTSPKSKEARVMDSKIERRVWMMLKEASLEEPTGLQIQYWEWVFPRLQEIMSCRPHRWMAVLESLNSCISCPVPVCMEENSRTGTMDQRSARLARRILGE